MNFEVNIEQNCLNFPPTLMRAQTEEIVLSDWGKSCRVDARSLLMTKGLRLKRYCFYEVINVANADISTLNCSAMA